MIRDVLCLNNRIEKMTLSGNSFIGDSLDVINDRIQLRSYSQYRTFHFSEGCK